MIQVCMGEQYVVDTGGIKAERFGIFLVEFSAALMEPAVDQDPLPGAFDQMTGARDTSIGTMKG
jgi:hypothetical protein